MTDEKIIKSPDTERDERIPPRQQKVDDFPVLHHGMVPIIEPANWNFSIFGLVEKGRMLTFNEFNQLPQVNVHADIHCVTGWSKLDTMWEGVSALEIKNLVDINPKAKHVLVHAAGNFTTNLTIEEFFQEDVLFATKFDGEPLTPEHGYPVRLVVPRLYFWKSAKWVVGIEFMEKDKRGFWESSGYHNHGDPWTEERYSSQE